MATHSTDIIRTLARHARSAAFVGSTRIGVALAGCALATSAAHARTAEDEQVWFNATVMQTTRSGFAWFAEVQPRFGDGANRLQQLILRPAVGWQLRKNLSVFAGYAHVAMPR